MQVFTIYLAGPCDGISAADTTGWRDELATEFPSVLFVRPDRAYDNQSYDNAAAFDHMNRHLIKCSSAVVANLSGPGRGLGTLREIEFARAMEKYVSVACDIDKMKKSLLSYDLHLFPTPAEATHGALEFLTEVVNQPHPLFGVIRPPQADDDE